MSRSNKLQKQQQHAGSISKSDSKFPGPSSTAGSGLHALGLQASRFLSPSNVELSGAHAPSSSSADDAAQPQPAQQQYSAACQAALEDLRQFVTTQCTTPPVEECKKLLENVSQPTAWNEFVQKLSSAFVAGSQPKSKNFITLAQLQEHGPQHAQPYIALFGDVYDLSRLETLYGENELKPACIRLPLYDLLPWAGKDATQVFVAAVNANNTDYVLNAEFVRERLCTLRIGPLQIDAPGRSKTTFTTASEKVKVVDRPLNAVSLYDDETEQIDDETDDDDLDDAEANKNLPFFDTSNIEALQRAWISSSKSGEENDEENNFLMPVKRDLACIDERRALKWVLARKKWSLQMLALYGGGKLLKTDEDIEIPNEISPETGAAEPPQQPKELFARTGAKLPLLAAPKRMVVKQSGSNSRNKAMMMNGDDGDDNEQSRKVDEKQQNFLKSVNEPVLRFVREGQLDLSVQQQPPSSSSINPRMCGPILWPVNYCSRQSSGKTATTNSEQQRNSKSKTNKTIEDEKPLNRSASKPAVSQVPAESSSVTKKHHPRDVRIPLPIPHGKFVNNNATTSGSAQKLT